MRENQLPKYLNTSDGELYHKRAVLFGIDLARPAAAKAGRIILVEGYTDVLALHQAGLANSVAIMGTSLTEEQVSALERVVGVDGVLELCLDADRAGQAAMLRAAQLADGRRLKLRVVPLPEGLDPAELIDREGGDRLRERVAASVPFVVFHVERILARADATSAEGRDRAIAELAPALKLDAYAGALREELPRRISNRLGLTTGQLQVLVDASSSVRAGPAGGATSSSRSASQPGLTDPAVRSERAFLVLCVALPEAGRRALQAIDPDQHLTSERLRRAARHLAGQTEMPQSGLAPEDEELAHVMADLVARAGRAGDVSVEQLEQQRLLLERARLERAIRRAREEGGPKIGELAREREQVLGEIRAIDARLERAV